MGELVREKIIIPLSKCLPGMVLLQPIVDEKTGAVLLPKGSVLTEEAIKKVHLFQHTQVWVDINTEDKIWQTNESILQSYKDYAATLRAIMGEKTQLEEFGIIKLKKLVKGMIVTFTSDFDLLACVNLMSELERDC